MKILITGINGYIGSNLKNFLKKKNNKIFGIKSKTSVKDYNKLIRDKVKPDVIIHCAGSGLVGVNQISHYIHKKKNVDSTKQLIKFIKKLNINGSKIIFLSSQAVYGKINSKKISENNLTKPISAYGKTKLLAEKELKKINYNYIIILRLFSIYGIGLRKQIIWDACCKFKKNNYFFRGNGLEKRDFLSIKDFNNLIKLIIMNKKPSTSIYNVGSGVGTQIKNLVDYIKVEFKIKNKINYTGNPNIIENQNYISSNDKIKKKFNWKCISKLKIEIKKYVKWFKKNIN